MYVLRGAPCDRRTRNASAACAIDRDGAQGLPAARRVELGGDARGEGDEDGREGVDGVRGGQTAGLTDELGIGQRARGTSEGGRDATTTPSRTDPPHVIDPPPRGARRRLAGVRT